MRKISLQTFFKNFVPKHKKCFLLTFFCALSFSCGKKARYPASSDERRTDELVSHNKTLVITDIDPIHRIVAEENSTIHLPESIAIVSGAHNGRQAYLSFNIEEYAQFYCTYHGIGSVFEFTDCYQDIDDDGQAEALGFRAGDKVVQAKGKALELELSISETGGAIKAQVELDIAQQ